MSGPKWYNGSNENLKIGVRQTGRTGGFYEFNVRTPWRDRFSVKEIQSGTTISLTRSLFTDLDVKTM